MPSVVMGFVQRVNAGGDTVIPNPFLDLLAPFTVSWDAVNEGPELNIGDTFTVDGSGPGNGVTCQCLGVSETGTEIAFSFIDRQGNVRTGFLSFEDFAPGTSPPTFGDFAFVCFLAGTMIATPDGERPVETLETGNFVVAADGSTRTIRWIGRQSVVSVFANPLRGYPIRLAAGALGDGLPKRDLLLSPDHAVLIDGVLVHAGALVNDTSITRVTTPEKKFTYYHIETEGHALILAEGTPAETFIDNVSRRKFHNYPEYEAIYGEETVIPELDLPRAMSARQVPRATRDRLAAIATTLRFGTGMAA